MDRDEWKKLIEENVVPPPRPVTAVVFHKVFGTDSLPMLVTASDNVDYVVKAPWSRPNTWRMNDPSCNDHGKPGAYMRAIMVNEQVVGRVATAIDAPTPPVALISVEPDFLDANQDEIRAQVKAHGYPEHDTFRYFEGIAHGSRFITTLGARQGFNFIDAYPQNRERMASLAVFYGLVGIYQDLQCFYDTDTKKVYSIDHGLAFGGSPFWGMMNPAVPEVGPNKEVVAGYGLAATDVEKAVKALAWLDTTEVRLAVCSPPDGWNIEQRDRAKAAKYLWDRKGSFPK